MSALWIYEMKSGVKPPHAEFRYDCRCLIATLYQPEPKSSYNLDVNIELKGLSREQVTNLLPEGLISLCWRGSVAHGMYVPKSDPDSIDDKDVMGVYIAPSEHCLGFGRRDVLENWEGEWHCVFYELRKFIELTFQMQLAYSANSTRRL